jgi:predicted O-linked N-acetylglucosamine transferase (SPINDLY family)
MTDVTLPQQLQQARLDVDGGRLEQAEAKLRQILAQHPDSAEALNLLGLVAWRGGHADAAIHAMGRAVELAPNAANYHFDLGCVLLSSRRFAEAEPHLRTVVAMLPNERGGWNNLGALLVGTGRHEEAAECFRRAIALAPQIASYHANLAKALEVLYRLDEAEGSARKAVELSPQGGSEWGVLGSVLVTRGRLSQGINAYVRALQLAPQLTVLRFNLASALRLQGQVEESIAIYRQALTLDPADARGHSSLLLTLHCSPAITPQALFEEHRTWAFRHAHKLSWAVAPHDNDRSPDRRLRIGYVSPDFREHAVASFIEPALTLDPEQFEVFCYTEEFRADDVSRRLKALAPNWRNTAPLSDDAMVEQIRADRIDILVDLAGHTADNRLLVFARRPAPVQATYLGYPNTTGMVAMNWRITDALADPIGITESLHTEKLMRLATSAWCYRPPDDAPDPARDVGPITFASFNALPKVSETAIALWSQILAAVPTAKLLLKSAAFEDVVVCDRCRQAFARHGVAPERIDLVLTTPSIREHMAMYNRVDIALDTMPYNGTTTTCEALWMAVPVITLSGESHVSRVGTSLLTNAGLSDLVAKTPDKYVRIAIDLAANESRRRELRSSLRDQLRNSSLMNAKRMSADLAEAYRAMWRDWCFAGAER